MIEHDYDLHELTERLDTIRRTGVRGTAILMHRSLRNITLSRESILAIVLLPLFFDILLWVKLDAILHFWAQLFDFWMQRLSTHGKVDYTPIWLFKHTISIPFPSMNVHEVHNSAIWLNIVVCVILLYLSIFIPSRFMPATSLLRAVLVIQISASLYNLLSEHSVPYTMAEYLGGMISLGVYLLFLISPVLAFIYYVFGFSFAKKAITTAIIIAHFILLIPFQYMLHALIISKWGLLFLPVLYLMFGPLLITLMFVSWYSWAMTRNTRDLMGANSFNVSY